jgi:hypothetical protein
LGLSEIYAGDCNESWAVVDQFGCGRGLYDRVLQQLEGKEQHRFLRLRGGRSSLLGTPHSMRTIRSGQHDCIIDEAVWRDQRTTGFDRGLDGAVEPWSPGEATFPTHTPRGARRTQDGRGPWHVFLDALQTPESSWPSKPSCTPRSSRLVAQKAPRMAWQGMVWTGRCCQTAPN